MSNLSDDARSEQLAREQALRDAVKAVAPDPVDLSAQLVQSQRAKDASLKASLPTQKPSVPDLSAQQVQAQLAREQRLRDAQTVKPTNPNNLSAILRESQLSQEAAARAAITARAESARPVLRIGDRIGATGQYEVIHPDGSKTSNGVKIFNASYQHGQVVRHTQAVGQPTIALDWKNVAKRKEVVRVTEQKIPQRIIALGNYYDFSDSTYLAFPDNKTFALNLFDWLAIKGKRIATYSTASLLAVGGDVSIDAPLFYSELQADLTAAGFTITTIDFSTGNLGATLADCDIFYLPSIVDSTLQLDVSKAQLLAKFAKKGNGLAMVSYLTNNIYTGIAEVFGIQSIPAATNPATATPISPVPDIATDLLSGFTSYQLLGSNLIYPTPTNQNRSTKLFETPPTVDPEYSLAYAIELK